MAEIQTKHVYNLEDRSPHLVDAHLPKLGLGADGAGQGLGSKPIILLVDNRRMNLHFISNKKS